jgi:Ca2+-binding EF-hand superfamily protein
MFALIDTDSDGTISLQEFQAAHERIFKAMDTNKDGKLTLEELQAKRRRDAGESLSEIGRLFGVNYQTIGRL